MLSPAWAVLPLLLCAVAGVFVGDASGHVSGFWAAWAVASAACTWAALRRRSGTLLAACCCTTCLFAALARAVPVPPAPSPMALGPNEHLWRAQVVQTPSLRGPTPETRRPHTTVRLLAQRRHGQWCPEQGRATLTLRAGPELARGDVIQIRLVVWPLPDKAPPWGLSTLEVMRKQQVSARAIACARHTLEHRAQTLAARSDHARQRAAGRLQRTLGPQAGGIAQALALGDTDAIAEQQRAAWADAGIAHLLAVSGLHVGLVARLTLSTARRLLALGPGLAERCSLNRLAALCALPMVWAYALFTGGAVSAQRAALMLSLVLGRQILGRGPGSAAHALGVAGLVILWSDPLAALTASFWLSFVSVACLLAAPSGQAALPLGPDAGHRPGGTSGHGRRLVHLLARSLRATGRALAIGGVAALGTAPLCVLFFGKLSLVAPGVNLVAVPLGGLLATPLSIGTAVLSAWVAEDNPVLKAWAWLCMQVLHALDALAQHASAWPYASVQATWPLWRASLAACALMAIAWLARALRPNSDRPLSPRAWAALALVVALGAIAWPPGHNPDSHDGRGVLGVWHLDVGQGDSTLVHLPNHTWMLVDGGGASWPGQPDPGRWAVASALRALGVTQLALVVLTHPHPDHMNGLKHVLEAWPVGTFWRNEDAERSPFSADLDRLVRARGGTVGRPPRHSTWGGVNIEAFLPLVGSKASVNDRSIVLRLAYRQRSLLLMGDAEKAAEAHLAGDLLASDILKVGHHGSRTSTTQNFLARIAPMAAVISCGAQNRFGHPHPSTLDALRAQGSQVLRTDEAGALHLRTDGVGGWTVACRASSWHALQIARRQGSATGRPK